MENAIAGMQLVSTLHGKIWANAGSRDQTQVVRRGGHLTRHSLALLPLLTLHFFSHGVYYSCRSPWHIKPLEIPSLIHLTLLGQLFCLPKLGVCQWALSFTMIFKCEELGVVG